MIDLDDVTQHYGVRPVLRGISLHIERGEVVVIPGYDQVFVAPLLIFAIGPSSVYSLYACGLPLDVSMAISIGLTVLVAAITPPRLRRWRLIGQHRIVFVIPQNQSKANAPFVQVG